MKITRTPKTYSDTQVYFADVDPPAHVHATVSSERFIYWLNLTSHVMFRRSWGTGWYPTKSERDNWVSEWRDWVEAVESVAGYDSQTTGRVR